MRYPVSDSVTPPIEDPTFLESPVATLVDSLTSSAYTCHDLINAYTTLNFRLSLSQRLVAQKDAPLRALDAIRENARPVAQAIRRDTLRAQKDPFPGSQSLIASSSSVTALELRIQVLQDEVAVCHAALQLISVIFQFSRLTSIFRSTSNLLLA